MSVRGRIRRIRDWASRELAALRLRRGYRREVRHALAQGKTPVIVFTMAKSASTSVEVSLMQLPELAVYKVHRLHPARIRGYLRERRQRGEAEPYRFVDDLGLVLYREIIRRRIPARIVVLVRDPIARNFSAYFHILEVLWKRADAHSALAARELAEGFLERGRHRVPLDWFDEEFRPVFGIDVISTPFPHGQGYVRLAAGPFQILVLRADLEDGRKAACLAEWLGSGSFRIVRMNEADETRYADTYAAARRALRLPKAYVEDMLESRYARHFFAPAELATLRARWSGERTGAGAEQPAGEGG